MLRIAICGGEEFAVTRIKKLTESALAEHSPEISEFTSAYRLLSAVEDESYSPEMALLYIPMPGVDGISLAKELNRLAPSCRIIFISGYTDFADGIYEAEYIYYVLKTQLEERLPTALNKAFSDLNSRPSFALIKSGASHIKLPLNKLLYIERKLHRTIIYTAEETYVTTQAPSNLLAGAEGSSFIHCHQSYWVNSRAIQSMGASFFKLISGVEIPISRAKKAEAKELFFRSLTE